MRTRHHAIFALVASLGLGGCFQNTVEVEAKAPDVAVSTSRAPSIDEYFAQCDATLEDSYALRSMLLAGRYDDLERGIDAIYAAYWDDPACEARLWWSLSLLWQQDLAALDAWVRARPDSWHAISTRGEHYVRAGYAARGTRFARNVTDEQWQGMRANFEKARADLARALEIEPRAAYAVASLIRLLRAGGDKDEVIALLDAFLELDPTNYGVRRDAMSALDPRWGGSYDAMEAVAKHAQQYVDRNPRLLAMKGFPIAARAKAAWGRKDYDEATVGYQRALEHGNDFEWYSDLCIVLSAQKRWHDMIKSGKRWIEDHPREAKAYHCRGLGYEYIRSLERALADYDRAIELDPRFERAFKHRARVRESNGDANGAIADLRAAHEIDPKNHWTLESLGRIYMEVANRPADGIAAFRKLVALDRSDPVRWFRLGLALHFQKDPEAKPVLRQYLTIAEGDSDEATRVARARQILNSQAAQAPATMPGLSRITREVGS